MLKTIVKLLIRVVELLNTIAINLVLIKQQNVEIMANLTALQAAVAAETAVDAAVEKLLTTLASDLVTANANNDQAAIDQIVATMQQNASVLSAAVTANTPAASVSSSDSGSSTSGGDASGSTTPPADGSTPAPATAD